MLSRSRWGSDVRVRSVGFALTAVVALAVSGTAVAFASTGTSPGGDATPAVTTTVTTLASSADPSKADAQPGETSPPSDMSTFSETSSSTSSTTSTTVASPTRVDTILTGATRYETAILVSQRAYPAGAPAVVLVKGDDYPDALAAAPLAFALGGPVILTPSTDVPAAVAAELVRLDPAVVYYVGLPASLMATVEAVLPGVEIRTLVGADRYATAALVAGEVLKKRGSVDSVVLVSGDRFPDALSVAPLAAKMGWPILLTPQAGPLPPVTSGSVLSLGVSSALVVGTDVTPPPAVTNVVKLVGRDRYYTSALVGEYALARGLKFTHVALATGENYPDALVVGPYLALDDGILLLTRPSGFSPPVNNLLAVHQDEIRALDFVGTVKSTLFDSRLATVPIPPMPVAPPILSWGATGSWVSQLEGKLAALRYDIGKADGVYDEALKDAVMAFQKAERLKRDGVAGAEVWERLKTARVPAARYYTSGTHVEVDLTRQVLFLVSGGSVAKILSASSGAPTSPTPVGHFRITRKLDYWRQSALGRLYMPSYFYGGIAIHGSYSVPAYPASHGCVRIPVWATNAIYYQMPVGMNVRVYR